MNTSIDSGWQDWPRAAAVRVGADAVHVRLVDGRELAVPLDWFGFLERRTEKELRDVAIIGAGEGLWWESIDEGVSVPSLLGLPEHAPPDPLTRTYTVDYRRDDDGYWIADVRGTDFSTFGRTLASAKRRSRELLRVYLEVPDLADAGIQVIEEVHTPRGVAPG